MSQRNNTNQSQKRNRGKRRRGRNNVLQAYVPSSQQYVSTYTRPIFGFIEPRSYTSLKYNTIINLSNAATTGASHKFKLNSIFDPDDTGAGHQPYGFDTVSSIYSKYTVIKVRYEIEFGPTSNRLMVGILTSSQSPTSVTTAATYTLAAESPFSKSKVLAFSGGIPATFKGSVTMNELMGLTPQQLISDDQYSASVTSDPSQLVYLMIFSYNPTSTNPVVTDVNVTLWMESVMFDPFLQNQS